MTCVPQPCRVFVFELNQEDAAAVVELMLGHDLLELVQIGIGVGHRRSHLASGHAGFDHQPGRITAHLPLRAGVRADADERVHVHFLEQREPGIKIVIIGEIVLAVFRFRGVPKDVGLDRVKAHHLEAPDAVAPQLARHAGVMDGAGGDEGGLAVEIEIAVLPMVGFVGCGSGREDFARAVLRRGVYGQDDEEGEKEK